MKFKLSYSLSGIHVDRDDELPIDVQISNYTKLTFWMREIKHQGQLTRTLCCDATTERSPPDLVIRSLEGLIADQLLLEDPPQEGLPYASLSTVIVDAAGKIAPNWGIPLSLTVRSHQNFQSQLRAEMGDAISNFVRLWRWRVNAASPHRPFAYINFTFSTDGSTWHNLPTDYGIGVFTQLPGLPTDRELLSTIVSLMDDGNSEPFPHELVREAKDLLHSTPRSALLIAMAALETGIKHYISQISPDTAPLIEKLPAPPVITLLQEIIPAMHARAGIRAKFFPLKKEASDYLRKWVTQRNQVAHGVKKNIDARELQTFIGFITDISYAFDALRGHAWAVGRIDSGLLVLD